MFLHISQLCRSLLNSCTGTKDTAKFSAETIDRGVKAGLQAWVNSRSWDFNKILSNIKSYWWWQIHEAERDYGCCFVTWCLNRTLTTQRGMSYQPPATEVPNTKPDLGPYSLTFDRVQRFIDCNCDSIHVQLVASAHSLIISNLHLSSQWL